MTEPSLHIWKALNANIAVIICKYPHDNYQMVRWTWENGIDKIERGQWLVNRKKIKFNRCSISPNGIYFTYFMFDFSKGYNTYTVISKVPYFTALYIQEEEGTWTGGAHFQNDNNVIMKPYVLMKNNLPPNMKIIDPCSPGAKSGGGGREERIITPTNNSVVIDNRNIHVSNGKLFANDVMIADFCNDTFQNVKAPY